MSPSIPGPHNERFLQIAESLKPELTRTSAKPLRAIQVVKDENALMGWSAQPLDSNGEDRVLHKGDSVIFDFGELAKRHRWLRADGVLLKRSRTEQVVIELGSSNSISKVCRPGSSLRMLLHESRLSTGRC